MEKRVDSAVQLEENNQMTEELRTNRGAYDGEANSRITIWPHAPTGTPSIRV